MTSKSDRETDMIVLGARAGNVEMSRKIEHREHL
jgi:hypothetical protein